MKFPIANVLTLTRIAMIPVVVACFYLPYQWTSPAAAIAFIIAAITDSLDGYLARKLGQMTRLGAFLDPVADKLMVATALVLLASHDIAQLRLMMSFSWFDPRITVTIAAAVIIGREITISALREWMAEIGARRKVAVSSIGKWKTIFQMTGLSMMLFRENLFGLPIYEVGLYCLLIAVILTLWSMVVYLRAAWPDLRGSVDV
jgi:CDP-diacylglycerol--glycerol-3-phosphate 3-phosphatidyltransferase/cardiolipin synthase